MNMYHPEQQNVGYTISTDMSVATHKCVHELPFESGILELNMLLVEIMKNSGDLCDFCAMSCTYTRSVNIHTFVNEISLWLLKRFS